MELTEAVKVVIDNMDYHSMLRRWRRAPSNDPFINGESGEYLARRMVEMRKKPGGQTKHIVASKAVGWEKTP